MKIQWFGHSSFLITSNLGKRILTDPFNVDIGYTTYTGFSNIVTVSHNHFDHCNLKNITADTKVINSIGTNVFDFCTITGFPSFHDDCDGLKRGKNIVYLYELDGFRICHLGDLGHDLSKEFLDLIKPIDILFIPIGGNYTIDGSWASKIAKNIDATYIFPMHYKTNKLSLMLDGPEDFILSFKNVEKLKTDTIYIDPKEKINNSTAFLFNL